MRGAPFLLALLFVPPLAGVRAQVEKTPSAQAKVVTVHDADKPEKPSPHSSSLADYEAHLQALIPIVQQCAAARNNDACDPARVGDDETVNAPGIATREVRYGWLRNLLDKAELPDEKPDASVNSTVAAEANKNPGTSGAKNTTGNGNSKEENEDQIEPPGVQQSPVEAIKQILALRKKTTSELLTDAVARLKGDLAQAQQLQAGTANNHPHEHDILKQVLSQGIYSDLNQNPGRNRALEKLVEWLNKAFEGIGNVIPQKPWFMYLVIGAILAVVGLPIIWSMFRNEQRLRLRFLPDEAAAIAGAPSARGWELWWKDAESSAAEGEWREAIHYLYWASISRLESMRLWPADKARTPREYLGLLKADDPRRGRLLALTRSFERIWYGGREADEAAYRNATSVARELMDTGGNR